MTDFEKLDALFLHGGRRRRNVADPADWRMIAAIAGAMALAAMMVWLV